MEFVSVVHPLCGFQTSSKTILNPVSVVGMVFCREELVKLIDEAKAKITGQ